MDRLFQLGALGCGQLVLRRAIKLEQLVTGIEHQLPGLRLAQEGRQPLRPLLFQEVRNVQPPAGAKRGVELLRVEPLIDPEHAPSLCLPGVR